MPSSDGTTFTHDTTGHGMTLGVQLFVSTAPRKARGHCTALDLSCTHLCVPFRHVTCRAVGSVPAAAEFSLTPHIWLDGDCDQLP